jgi:hypothetical protein
MAYRLSPRFTVYIVKKIILSEYGVRYLRRICVGAPGLLYDIPYCGVMLLRDEKVDNSNVFLYTSKDGSAATYGLKPGLTAEYTKENGNDSEQISADLGSF